MPTIDHMFPSILFRFGVSVSLLNKPFPECYRHFIKPYFLTLFVLYNYRFRSMNPSIPVPAQPLRTGGLLGAPTINPCTRVP